MKRSYLHVRQAPRNTNGLLVLSRAEQENILLELRALSSGGGLLSAKKFAALSNEERASYLYSALKDYDRATAYSVCGIAMPVRTVDDAVNQQSWNLFAERIQEAVSDLNRDERSQIATHFMEGGVIIVGHHLSESDDMPRVVAIPLSAPPGMDRVERSEQSEVGSLLSRLMSELSLLGMRGVRADHREVEEVINKAFHGKPAAFLQEAISRAEAVVSSMEKGTDVPSGISSVIVPYLRRIAEILKVRLQEQVC